MKTGFFYGVFAGFILGCLFFFGVTTVRGQETRQQGDGQSVSYLYYHGGPGTTIAYEGTYRSAETYGGAWGTHHGLGGYTGSGGGYVDGGII